jgi:NADH:ubiquinone oxidoreductase subunit 2 (subunit N)
VIGAFLYLRIMVSMWMEDSIDNNDIVVPRGVAVVIATSVAVALILGFFPDLILNASRLVRFVPL